MADNDFTDAVVKVEPKPAQPKLRIVKYTNNDNPYTAFVALTLDEFADVIEAGTGDLTNYQKKIVSVVEGHNPTEEQLDAARDAFIRVHTDARGPLQHPANE